MEVLSTRLEGFHVQEGAHKMEAVRHSGDCDDFLAACMGGGVVVSPEASVDLPIGAKAGLGVEDEARAVAGEDCPSSRQPLWKRMQNLQALEPTYYKSQPSPIPSPGTSPSGVLDMSSGLMGSGTFSDASGTSGPCTAGGGSSPVVDAGGSGKRSLRRRSKLLEDLDTVAGVPPVPEHAAEVMALMEVAGVTPPGEGGGLTRRRSKLAADIDQLLANVQAAAPLRPGNSHPGSPRTSLDRRRSRLLQDLDTVASLSPSASYLDVPILDRQ